MAYKTLPGIGEQFLGDMPAVLKTQRITAGVSSTLSDVTVGSSAVTLFAVPTNTIVYSVMTRVLEAFPTSATLTIGDTNTSGYMTSAMIGPTTAVADDGALLKPGMASSGAAYQDGFRFYKTADVITITPGGAYASGQLEIFIQYMNVQI